MDNEGISQESVYKAYAALINFLRGIGNIQKIAGSKKHGRKNYHGKIAGRVEKKARVFSKTTPVQKRPKNIIEIGKGRTGNNREQTRSWFEGGI